MYRDGSRKQGKVALIDLPKQHSPILRVTFGKAIGRYPVSKGHANRAIAITTTARLLIKCLDLCLEREDRQE